MYERVKSNWRLIFLVCLIFLIIFETYFITNSGFQFERATTYQRFMQKSEKELKLKEESLKSIDKRNKPDIILNEDKFGPLQNDSVIILIQVHNRIIYLQHLIKSLENAANISQALLIFSHDYYDEEINELVGKIHFCKVLQIFYPYYEKNERNVKVTQVKHHWWWKANYVFDQLDATKHFSGLVMFLEEDHYVSEEFLYILKLMEKQSPKMCPRCEAYALGNHLDLDFFEFSKADHVEVVPWEHNMGFAINRTIWNNIVKCSGVFCMYDDYNWDFTFRFVSQRCLPRVLATMVVRRPRVFHIGECGVHIKKDNCDPIPVVERINRLQQNAFKSNKMFPKRLKLGWESLITQGFGPNGGWTDDKDHKLCMSFVRNDTTNTN